MSIILRLKLNTKPLIALKILFTTQKLSKGYIAAMVASLEQLLSLESWSGVVKNLRRAKKLILCGIKPKEAVRDRHQLLIPELFNESH